jgi:protein TonB
MDYARQQRDPARHLIGITFVVLLHLLIIYAMVTGLARKAVEVIKKPLSATIIEEIKAPPPPPPPPKKIEPQQQQKVQAPQETYVPPPDIPVATTSQDAPVISATTSTAPTEPHVIAPPPVVAPPAPAPRPAVRQGVQCADIDKPGFPREARKAGVDKGEVNAIVQIDEQGNVFDVQIVSSNPPRVFDRVVKESLINWKKCTADGTKYKASVLIVFNTSD